MFWKRFDKIKPKEDGWYQCSIEFHVTENETQRYVMDLYWYSEAKRFIDNRRKNVFDEYDVYGYGSDNTKKKLYQDNLVDRTDSVTAWRKVPKPYKSIRWKESKMEKRITQYGKYTNIVYNKETVFDHIGMDPR